MARFHATRAGQTAPGVTGGRGGATSRTAMSRGIVPHPPDVSVARHVPAAGAAISAYQKYGGPPWRSRDLAATLPSGAISDSSPASGFSAATMTRNGAPFHGAVGVDKTAMSAASSQAPEKPSARDSTAEKRQPKNAAAISNDPVAAEPDWRSRNTLIPFPGPRPELDQSANALAESWQENPSRG